MESETQKILLPVRRSAKSAQLTPEQLQERGARFAEHAQATLRLLSMNHALVIKEHKAAKK
jgi:hypothetical protein